MNNLPARLPYPQSSERKNRITLTGRLIKTQHGEGIIVKFRFWTFQVNLLVNIPFEGEKTSPVYVQLEPVSVSDVISPVASHEEEFAG